MSARMTLAFIALAGCFSDPGVDLDGNESSSESVGDASSASSSASSTSVGTSASGSGSGSASEGSSSAGESEGSEATSAAGSDGTDEAGASSDEESTSAAEGSSSGSTGEDPLESVYGPCTPECADSPLTGCTECWDGVACPGGGGVCTSACPGGDPNECPAPGPQGWLECIVGNCYITCAQAPCPDGMTCAQVNLDGNKDVCVWAD